MIRFSLLVCLDYRAEGLAWSPGKSVAAGEAVRIEWNGFVLATVLCGLRQLREEEKMAAGGACKKMETGERSQQHACQKKETERWPLL